MVTALKLQRDALVASPGAVLARASRWSVTLVPVTAGGDASVPVTAGDEVSETITAWCDSQGRDDRAGHGRAGSPAQKNPKRRVGGEGQV